ncbi:MAG: PilZ domain-containing protein [Bdellovibrionales bacterium]|nr:PilZ domain-containing protein [Bdellovibrionales bacterium]
MSGEKPATGIRTGSELSGIRRRRVPRRTFLARVGLLIGGEYQLGRCFEIGEGGMLLACVGSLEVGRRVVVTFRIPGSGHTVVRGEVRYIQPGTGRIGIEFLNLDFNMKRAIRTFVASKTDADGAESAA